MTEGNVEGITDQIVLLMAMIFLKVNTIHSGVCLSGDATHSHLSIFFLLSEVAILGTSRGENM